MSELVTVFGGSGFVGKYVVRALCKAGKRVRVAMRRPHLGHELRVMGDVGQVQLVQANVRDLPSVERAIDGADTIINLVAILFEKNKQKFDDVVFEGAKNIATAAKNAGITKFVQVSAIGADVNSASKYAIAKGKAEEIVKELVPSVRIIRPSVIFGIEDEFINRFAAMSLVTPIMPLIGGGKTKFQPVFVADVASAILKSLDNAYEGQVFELGGPSVYTFEQILKYIEKETMRSRSYLPIPFEIMQIIGNVTASIFKFLPIGAPPITGDQVELLKKDNLVTEGAKSFKDLGINSLSTLEAIAPTYLYRYRPRGQFEPRIV